MTKLGKFSDKRFYAIEWKIENNFLLAKQKKV